MKIIIAGGGKIGSTLTAQLSAEGHEITVVDRKAEVLENIMESYDVIAVQGNSASMDVLEQADVQEANLLIAATDTDEVNLLSCMTA
ncbi:MAG: NAD-binding protein [Lachnospiraceae bacterium]|nr:NAD-binding protein [Lachnospiraceae bacterium]